MEIEAIINKRKEIYNALIEYIDTTDNYDLEFLVLSDTFEKHGILENIDDIKLIFQIITKIADNHHRTSDFMNKIDKICQYLITDNSLLISDIIYDPFNYNKQILLHILQKGYAKPDQSFLNYYLNNSNIRKLHTYYYLYPGMKRYIDEKTQNKIEIEITQKFGDDISTFEEKYQVGANDSYICSLIRKDSVKEFIAYTNQKNLSLCARIKPSIYETNSFLINKRPTLIEYAAFYGSIQIIQFLKYNNIPLTSTLWLYAIHSNNAELIHFLEENVSKPKKSKTSDLNMKKLYGEIFKESIKCHHNEIATYVRDNLLNQSIYEDELTGSFVKCIQDYFNYYFYPDDINSLISNPNSGFHICDLFFSLSSITIPSSVISIGNGALKNCSSLKKLSIPSSIQSIGNSAFSGCSSLEQIEIPPSLISIGEYSFDGCSSLVQLSIPPSVVSIGNGAFANCLLLNQISIPSSLTEMGKSAFVGCSSLSQISIPPSLTKIKNNTFEKCTSIKQILIPSSVTEIGDFAFKGCTSLTDISIPSSVTEIGEFAFDKCSSLTEIAIPRINSINQGTFKGCLKLKKMKIPSSVKKIGNLAFQRCISLTQIIFEIPSCVIIIGNNAFSKCSSLNKIVIPHSVTIIENYAFAKCTSLKQISFEIPSLAITKKYSAFKGCNSLKEISIPSSINSIANCTFYGCTNLKEISILNETNSNFN